MIDATLNVSESRRGSRKPESADVTEVIEYLIAHFATARGRHTKVSNSSALVKMDECVWRKK